MKLKKKLAILFASLTAALSLGGLATVPAQAITVGSLRACNASASFTDIQWFKADGSYYEWLHKWTPDINTNPIAECSDPQFASEVRVDTDPLGPSHSYKTRYDTYIAGAWDIGSWNACHTNSDNHSANPTDPTGSAPQRVIYRNYDHGDCTN